MLFPSRSFSSFTPEGQETQLPSPVSRFLSPAQDEDLGHALALLYVKKGRQFPHCHRFKRKPIKMSMDLY